MRRTALSLCWLVVIGPALGQSQLAAQEPELLRLKKHVETLASPEFAGRRDAGAQKARDYILGQFASLGLKPLFGDSFLQEIPSSDPGKPEGINLGARLVGTDPKLADEWVILGVHYDHLGRHGDTLFPGADDNASGVAMMLEVARCLSQSPKKPSRSIALVAFDLEERGPKGELGLRGSRHFARNSPIPLDKVALFMTADMIGRSLAGMLETTVFVLGTEREPEIRPWVESASAGLPTKVALLGSDLLVIDRSDYGPFRSRQIPYVFFTTGESEVYHTPNDVPETIDYPKLEAISKMMSRVVVKASGDAPRPRWASVPDNPVAEALAIREVLRSLLQRREQFNLSAYQIRTIENTLKTIEQVEARGSLTAGERTRIARVAQILMFSVF